MMVVRPSQRRFVFNARMQITRRRFVLTSLATPFVFSTVSGPTRC